MKKLLQLVILVSFILCSCGRQMSITKRKYTKGYYVSHTSKKAPVKGKDLSHTTKQESRETAVQKSEEEPSTVNEASESVTTIDPVKPSPTQEAGDKNITRAKGNKAPGLIKAPFVSRQLDNLIPSKLNKEFNKKHSVAGEALSLFWIVLLIILLFYLLGILFDGFGLGWVLHLFLLVFLILLILWLLHLV